jgi:hypothetical protein
MAPEEPPDPIAVALAVARILDGLEVPWLIGGSLASSVHGEPRSTNDVYLETYNRKRPHRGRGMEGRTPYAVLKAGLKEAKKAARTKPPKQQKKAA